MNRQEWHKWRNEGIGASDAPTIMCVSPWKTPYQLWEEKIFGKEESNNPATEHGKKYEPLAIKWFEKEMGISFHKEELDFLCAQSNEFPWMKATLDALDKEEKHMLEVKCPFSLENHEKVKISRQVPDIYFPQLQHQMKVKEKQWMYFLSYNWKDPDDSVILEVSRDNKYIEKLIEKEQKFWDCVLEMEPPELTERDWNNMEANAEWVNKAQEIRKIQEQLDPLEQRFEELRKDLIYLSNGQRCIGGGIKTNRFLCKGSVDYSKVPQLQNVDLEQYRKKSIEKWRVDRV